jgi:signal recognition particle subunit SRP54
MQQGKFTLDDFRSQMRQIKKLGSMREIMKMIPGLGRVVDQMGDLNPEDDMRRIEGIINSMTPAERGNPDLIDRSRRNRIAQGSGVQPAEVNKLLKDFSAMSKMMQDMSGLGVRDRMKAVRQLADGGLMNPGADMRDVGIRVQRTPANMDALRDKRKKQKKDAKKQKKRNRKR